MDNDHLYIWQLENTETAGDRAWFAYVAEAEKLLGVSGTAQELDGDETVDGYSLDSAHNAFLAGITPAEYAQGARA